MFSIPSFSFLSTHLIFYHKFLVFSNSPHFSRRSFLTASFFHSQYSCLRIAVGWILFHIRYVDDGKFRRSICEALCLCYIFQACVVIRAQLTDSNWINWVALLFLFSIGGLYGRFRFGMGGGLIKVYELPLSSRSELQYCHALLLKLQHTTKTYSLSTNRLSVFWLPEWYVAVVIFKAPDTLTKIDITNVIFVLYTIELVNENELNC